MSNQRPLHFETKKAHDHFSPFGLNDEVVKTKQRELLHTNRRTGQPMCYTGTQFYRDFENSMPISLYTLLRDPELTASSRTGYTGKRALANCIAPQRYVLLSISHQRSSSSSSMGAAAAACRSFSASWTRAGSIWISGALACSPTKTRVGWFVSRRASHKNGFSKL